VAVHPRPIEALVLEHLPAAVVVGDAEQRVAYANRAARELYACERGTQLPPELMLALRNHAEWCGDVTFLGRRVHCRAAPLYDSARRLVGSITVSFERVRKAGSAADLEEIGSRIAAARTAAGLTQQELADRIGVTRRSVQGYEAGRVAPYRRLDRLAQALERPRAWFLPEDGGFAYVARPLVRSVNGNE
jgi:DNA-binding XRE family transcriptional regulator